MLDPPHDPLMRRGRKDSRDMYNPVPIMPSASGGGSSLGAGFDLDKVSSFDSEVSRSDDFSSSNSGESDSAAAPSAWYNPFGK